MRYAVSCLLSALSLASCAVAPEGELDTSQASQASTVGTCVVNTLGSRGPGCQGFAVGSACTLSFRPPGGIGICQPTQFVTEDPPTFECFCKNGPLEDF
jgi:hypothetical protein